MSPHPVRKLGTLVEPLAAGVYFAPEAHERYVALGAPADFWAGYYCSRGACLGQTPPEVVAAAFGVFNPAHLNEQMPIGWATGSTPEQYWAARVEGATLQLERLLGEKPDGAERATELLRKIADGMQTAGRPFYAGLKSMPWPGTICGDLWHAADLVREHRGDTHTAAWTLSYTAPEIMMLTELWWDLPHGSYLASRHWSPEDVARGLASIRSRGLVDGDPPTLTDAGLRARVELEDLTDAGEAYVLDAITDAERDELFGILAPMAATICAGGGYPADPNQRTLPGVEE